MTEKKKEALKVEAATKKKKKVPIWKPTKKKKARVNDDSEDEGSTPDDEAEVVVKKGGSKDGEAIIISSDSDLEITVQGKTLMRPEQARDLRTIFTDLPEWRDVDNDLKVIKQKAYITGWYKGGNSTCRHHIHLLHYPEYKKRCEEEKIEEDWQAVLKHILAEWKVKEEAEKGKTGGQLMLDGVMVKIQGPKAFSCEGILDAVTQHVVCSDQPLAVADNVSFRNCLVMMHPGMKKCELPSHASIHVKINNKFINFLTMLKHNIAVAPGKVCTLWDMWMVPHTLDPIMGMLLQWIKVREDGTWGFCNEVGAFHKIFGRHNGLNLEQYFVGLLDHVRVTFQKHSKQLRHIMNNNMSNNGTTMKEVQSCLTRHGVLSDFNAAQNTLRCFRHIIQLSIEDFMGQITQVAIAENKQAIWDYNPNDPHSLVNGSIDLIAVIHTLIVKIQVSGQWKQAFEELQIDGTRPLPLALIVHNNTHWGSGFGMTKRVFDLRKEVDSFILTANVCFGPIMTIKKKRQLMKHIPWGAFLLTESNWKCVKLCSEILEDADRYYQVCSTTRVPTLHQVIPTIESLMSHWEAKLHNPKYAIYHDALRAGLDKLNKYYKKLDNTNVYILALLLHPYYKLNYIEHQWGSEDEYLADLKAGELNARNWRQYAREVIDRAMERYWPN
ncbi:hypothetical protein V8D89_005389 [Ganoderma adspersum]